MKAEQAEVGKLADRTWDVLVVGGGPAGCAAAIELSRRGRSVLLLEKEHYPRDKPCGDALVEDSFRALQRIDMLETVRGRAYPISQAHIYSTRQFSVHLRANIFSIKRAQLDSLLAEAAARQGVTLAHGTATDIRLLDWGVECRVDRADRLWARLILLATGAESQLPRRLGFHLAAAGPEAVGIRCYIKSKARLRQAVASYDRDQLPGFSWIVPLGDGDYNVGCILFEPADPGPVLQRFLETFPLAKYLMSEQSRVGEPVAAPLRCGLPPGLPVADGRALLTGEAIYTTLPFTGEGVGTALESGILAADVLDRALADPEILKTWRQTLNDEMGPTYRTHEAAQRWMANRWLHELVCWRILRSSWMRGQVEALLGDHGDPTSICSWSAVMNSLRH